MKILFQNKTKYSKSIYKHYSEFHIKNYGLRYFIFSIVVFLFFIAYTIIQFKIKNYPTAIISIIILIVFTLWRTYRPAFITRKELNSDTISGEKTHTFSFYQNYFIVENNETATKTFYFEIYRAFETEKFYYLYMDKSHAFILNKSCFTIGTSENFSKFLKKKFWFKFKCKYT